MNNERMPQDRLLIQESLQKVNEGPEALMKWANEHRHQIDQKFINMLRKMIKFTEEAKQENLAKTFKFLEACFCKMFDFMEDIGEAAITKDNLEEYLKKAIGFLKQAKAREASRLLETISLFLAQEPNEKHQAIVDANLGIAYAQLGLKEKAIHHLQSAIGLPLGEMEKEKIYANLGTIYRDVGQIEKSMDHYQTALEMARKRQDVEMEIVHLNSLALANIDRQNLPEALLLEEKAHYLAQSSGNKILQQDCITKLAMITALMGDKERCKSLCEDGLKLFKSP